MALIPTRYPGTERETETALRLARATDWREQPGGAWHGVGQRMLTTDQAEVALLDVRVVALRHRRWSSRRAGRDASDAAADPPRTPMAEALSRDRLYPSLLDRLVDDEPGRATEAAREPLGHRCSACARTCCAT